MNKFIHPRNIYKNPPDFRELCGCYPEFKDICKEDETGKLSIDFQDENSLAILTKCLLHKDFKLTLEFPVNRLVPTLPLRLNYILWIEDILQTFGLQNAKGIDIGCGASCIYPLLAVRNNNWTMTGLEVDQESYASAVHNVKRNGLDDRISVVFQASDSSIFDGVLGDTDSSFDFCLCNPPFYKIGDSEGTMKNRTGNRPLPRNAKTGVQVELACDGGEIEFIKRIIAESMKFKNRIRVYTTMVGIKNDLFVLVKELNRLGITNYADTEFCQGRTTRWGLAWTFAEDDFYLRTVTSIKSSFVKEPAIFFIPEMEKEKVKDKTKVIEEALLRVFKDIEIEPTEKCSDIPGEKRWRMKLKKVSWTKTRQKRREHLQRTVDTGREVIEENGSCPAKKQRLEIEEPQEVILVGDIYLNTLENGHTLQIFYLDGRQGKDACQQILQYVINQFNKLF